MVVSAPSRIKVKKKKKNQTNTEDLIVFNSADVHTLKRMYCYGTLDSMIRCPNT